MFTSIQRYKNLVQIGTGSMGIVYSAKDQVLDREVALKVMRTGVGVDPDIRERFYREARACARLKHANIVSVYDLGEDGDVAYIAMEFLRGADLRKVIEQRRKLSLPVQLQAMIDICDALDHAHRHGVIHRDVKPSNLMLQEDNRVKVMDFGIARLTSSRLTMAGKILGTPNYMAPEQILGKPCDGRADLFSAGIVLFELLTWAHPFQAEVILKRIVEGEPDSIFDHSVNVPVPLERIITRALKRDPEERYATAGEMASDLRALLDFVRQNASPTMERMELPSDRMLPIEPPRPAEPVGAQVRQAPPGEESAEWRLSEVLRLIPSFEEAVDNNDQSKAAAHLQELRAIAANDQRFVKAVVQSEESFLQKWPADTEHRAAESQTRLEEQDRASAASASGGPATPVLPPRPFSSGTRESEVHPPLPPEVKPVPPERPKKVQPPSSPSNLQASLDKVRIPGLTASQTWLVIGALGGLAVLVLASALLKRTIFPVEALLPAAGSATVQSGTGQVKASASDTAELLDTLPRGARVNLLEVPQSLSTEWIHIQYVPDGKARQPGYVRVADLSPWHEWRVQDPQAALAFARLRLPSEQDSDGSIKEYMSAAGEFAARLPGPVADEVRKDVERLRNVVQTRNATGLPDNPSASVTQPPAPVQPAGTAPATSPSGLPNADPPALSPKDQAAQLVRQGLRNISLGEYGRAKRAALRAIELDGANREARKLLEEAEEWEKLSGSSSR